MTNSPPDEHIGDAESLQGYRYLVWMESETLWKEQDPIRRANLALSLAEYTATLARLEVEAVNQFMTQPEPSPAA
ncbi:MAG: hypothetical protein KME42_24935 [Tildeniella nuda ZEHNDER 1965/U140]|jgi:hypothetical protein|nr:hypothetical protein [Tildeniella nuda ZEHNDER 1965/U140]